MNTESNEQRLEMLAGYADGELGPNDRAQVEAWLAEHPQDRAHLANQQAFSRQSAIWQRTTAAPPSDSTWNLCLLKIRAAIQPATPAYRTTEADRPAPPARRSWQRIGMGMTMAAAAVLIAVGLLTSGPKPANSDSGVIGSDEAFVVATVDDVDILSHQGDDVILVGRPLLTGPLEIATIGDVGQVAIDSGLYGPSDQPHIVDPKRPMLISPGQPVP